MPTLAETIAEALRKQFVIRNLGSDVRDITIERVIQSTIAEHVALTEGQV